MNWKLYRSLHARGLTQARLAKLTGINRSVLARILTNEHGRGKESRHKLFPHLLRDEIQALGWLPEFLEWLKKTGAVEQVSTENIVPAAETEVRRG